LNGLALSDMKGHREKYQEHFYKPFETRRQKEVNFIVKLSLIVIFAVVAVNLIFLLFTGKPLFFEPTGKNLANIFPLSFY